MPRLGEQSPRRPPLHAAGDPACGTPQRFFWGGGPLLRCLTASVVRGLSFSWTAVWCPPPVRKAGRWRGPGTASATLDACRDLLADHLSYAARWGKPPFARGPPPAVPLG
ncbi:unnamed protein product [Pleuronectes platessa]|uniref:Uncharacterized protein n=1 Tax=Pleuronectes platessa TaxID=8262 RepID=A0A9N7W4T4_PLEPL|nr:unnamed protein product [Pleuronectes platessa]